ncbi:hypothetical protein V7J41_004172 [Salmonella enterica]|uniref:Uncharacterized protein n=6 Tax=Salmonella enterica TaxID=28901 RepID=A0A3Y2DUV2_SALET|nr:hypothetical protein [Salmonella enterica]EAA4588642.1 hypothetical protein [Salmonella enterica subsp. enterica serovar Typhimurium]EAA7302241.1 hypothetical protein [Salmonella enterica subsp. arizonae]EAA7638662.1 hypothetical protein [Salmonella enterica subsp. enterica]EAA8523816.1 hypothetical protein [Salmonella enterica subsp. enterica serovar Cerro]EAY0471181.1 hypothetical protein [Salmonella enterica subsp. enterica serovar Rissen]EBC9160691.1 hypothetical protein [Salmonella en
MNDFKTRRLNTIHATLQEIADKTLEISMSTFSDENKQKLIEPLMKRHAELIVEAQELLK